MSNILPETIKAKDTPIQAGEYKIMQVYSITITKILYDIFEPPGTPKNWVK